MTNVRSLTETEINKLRGDNHYTELYMVIHTPEVVYKARVNQEFTTKDRITEIHYDNGTGTFGNMTYGMTMYVGSTEGEYDKGFVRLRRVPDADHFYIGEESDIDWADNDYLTVVDEFRIWAKHLQVFAETTLMDYDFVYYDQHSKPDPIPILGPDQVLWSPSVFTPDGSQSYVIDGGIISSYAWTAAGATWASGTSTASPTLYYATPGTYRLDLTVTGSNGASFIGHRNVFVVDNPIRKFSLSSCSGDYENGGWEATIKMWDEPSLPLIRDRSKVIIFAKDSYNGVDGSIGQLPGYEHILMMGWIDGESIEWDNKFPSMEFSIYGPQYWLDKIGSWPTGIEDTTFADNGGGEPDRWTEFQNLTVGKGAWSFLHWRSTVTACMDAFITMDIRGISTVEGEGAASLWAQLDTMTNASILAKPVCDRYGRLFIEVNSQYLPTVSRESIPVVMHIDKADWRDRVIIQRKTVTDMGFLELSGIAYVPSLVTGTAYPYFSHANGTIFKPYGSLATKEKLLLSSQEQCNELAGFYMSQANNPYPSIQIPLQGNYRAFDIAPNQYLTLSCGRTENNRGILLLNKNVIPRRINYSYTGKTGLLLADIDVEAETRGENAITYIPPEPPVVNDPPDPGGNDDFPIVPDPPGNPEPPVVPPPVTDNCKLDLDAPANGPFQTYLSTATAFGCAYSDGTSHDGIPDRLEGAFLAALRDHEAVNKSNYVLVADFEATAGNMDNTGSISQYENTKTDYWYDIELLDKNLNVVARGVHDPVGDNEFYRTGKFDNTDAVDFDFIRVDVNGIYEPDDWIIASGTASFDGYNWGLAADGKTRTESYVVGGNRPYYIDVTADSSADVGEFYTLGQVAQMHTRFDGIGKHRFETGTSWRIRGYGYYSDYDTCADAEAYCTEHNKHFFSDSCNLVFDFSLPEFREPWWYIQGLNVGLDRGDSITGSGWDIDFLWEPKTHGGTWGWNAVEVVFCCGQGPTDPRINRTFHSYVRLSSGDERATKLCIENLVLNNLCEHDPIT